MSFTLDALQTGRVLDCFRQKTKGKKAFQKFFSLCIFFSKTTTKHIKHTLLSGIGDVGIGVVPMSAFWLNYRRSH